MHQYLTKVISLMCNNTAYKYKTVCNTTVQLTLISVPAICTVPLLLYCRTFPRYGTGSDSDDFPKPLCPHTASYESKTRQYKKSAYTLVVFHSFYQLTCI